MTRLIPTLALLAALAVAPVAAAEWYEGKPECPPDEYCTMSSAEDDNATKDDGPTYDGNCGGEVCAYDNPDEPVSSGDGDGATCMDGAAEGEVCRDDVRYLDGREPDLGYDESHGAPVEDVKESPAGGAALALAALAGLAVAARRR